MDARNGRGIPGATLSLLDGDRTESFPADAAGRATLKFTPMAALELRSPGFAPRRVSVFLDYPPVQRCLEYGMTGQWLFEQPNCLTPGQVPWRAFQFEPLRDALRRIRWRIELQPEETRE